MCHRLRDRKKAIEWVTVDWDALRVLSRVPKASSAFRLSVMSMESNCSCSDKCSERRGTCIDTPCVLLMQAKASPILCVHSFRMCPFDLLAPRSCLRKAIVNACRSLAFESLVKAGEMDGRDSRKANPVNVARSLICCWMAKANPIHPDLLSSASEPVSKA